MVCAGREKFQFWPSPLAKNILFLDWFSIEIKLSKVLKVVNFEGNYFRRRGKKEFLWKYQNTSPSKEFGKKGSILQNRINLLVKHRYVTARTLSVWGLKQTNTFGKFTVTAGSILNSEIPYIFSQTIEIPCHEMLK